MALTYHPWITINVNHEYLGESSIPLDLIPTQDTARILEANNILLRKDSNSSLFQFYYRVEESETHDEEIMLNRLIELGELKFEVTTGDEWFFNYTELPFPKTETSLEFRNEEFSDEMEILEAENTLVQPNAIGNMIINTNLLNSPSLQLSFMSRNVYWEYSIIIPEGRNIQVESMSIDGGTLGEFNGPVESLIMNTQKSQNFTSKEPIKLIRSLESNPVIKFSYITPPNNNSQNLELKLPNLNPNQLAKYGEGPLKGRFYVKTIVYV
ncbi:MAG: hypothetical protein HKN48_06000 [Flavobacteriaceae bacterium]|nr:hypothetical protein [Flavobacteriaceae bacterium]